MATNPKGKAVRVEPLPWVANTAADAGRIALAGLRDLDVNRRSKPGSNNHVTDQHVTRHAREERRHRADVSVPP